MQPHILPVLAWASQHGVAMAILSSNTEALIAAFLATHLPAARFTRVVGGVSLFAKHRALAKLIRTTPAAREPWVYVGDEVRDIRAARRVGIPSLAVTWGKDRIGAAGLRPAHRARGLRRRARGRASRARNRHRR